MRKQLLVIGLIFFVIALGSGVWLWWALSPGAPSATTDLPPVPPLPDAPEDPLPQAMPEPPPSVEPVNALPMIALGPIDEGTLAIEIRGQSIGTEHYTLERQEDGSLLLRSHGKLNFKIALFTVQATFAQVMTFTAERRPVSYQLALSGPLGVGDRKVSASFGASVGIVDDGQKRTEIVLPQEPFLLLGMFSSYALVPLWAQQNLPHKLKVVSMRGDRRDGGPEIWVTLERLRSVHLRGAGAQTLPAEEYLLKSERFNLKLYLSEERLLGLHNDSTDKDQNFWLYRSDLFPEGFAVLPDQ